MRRVSYKKKAVMKLLHKFLCTVVIFAFTMMPLAAEDSAQISQPASNPENQQETPSAEAQKTEQRKLSPEEAFSLPISLDLRNIDVVEALKFLASKSGLNIVPTKNVSGRVTLTIDNVPFRDVFDLMLRSNGLAYVKIGEIYSVMTETEY